MFQKITDNTITNYEIATPGKHIFYIENISANITFFITAKRAHVYVYGLYNGTHDDRYALIITQIHSAAESKSTTLIKSALNDQSHFHFTGKIRIEKKARHAHAELDNHNLLLSEHAHAISIPQLEVYQNEVTCMHRSSTKPLDPDQLAYLSTRGVTETAARELLINAFCDEVNKVVQPYFI